MHERETVVPGLHGRRFIKKYSIIAHPLTEKTKGAKTRSLVPNTNAVAAFETRKRKFCSAPLLVHFDTRAPTRVIRDASDYAIGAQLEQLQRGEW